jgi:hypothetical protein
MAENPLVTQIRQKLGRLNDRAGELETLSQQNRDALGPGSEVGQRIAGIRQRIQGLGEAIANIVRSKAELEQVIGELDTGLGDLEGRLQTAVQGIDVTSLLEQLQGLDEDIAALERSVTAAGAPPPPAGPPAAPGAGDGNPVDVSAPGRRATRLGGGKKRTRKNKKGGYVVPNKKRESLSRNSSGRRSTGRNSTGRNTKRKGRN